MARAASRLAFRYWGHAAVAQRRNLQTGYVVGTAQQASPDSRHLVWLEGDVGAEGFGLNREVHYHRGGSRVIAFGQCPYGVEVHLAVAHGINDAPPCHLNSGMSHYGQGRHLSAADDGLNPFGHVNVHRSESVTPYSTNLT